MVAYDNVRQKTLATGFVAIMLVATFAVLGVASVPPVAAHDPGTGVPPADHGSSDEQGDGFWNVLTGFTTKAGYRLIFAWDTDEPIVGVVEWGFAPDALTEIARPLGDVIDSAQIAILDLPQSEVDSGKTVHWRVHDLASGALSPIQSFQMGNAWTSDTSDGVYEINALLQMTSQSLPADVPFNYQLKDFAAAIEVFAERVWDATDGYVRIGNVIVTDTALNYPVNVPGGTFATLTFGDGSTLGGGACPPQWVVEDPGPVTVDGWTLGHTFADFLVEDAPPADSHTFAELNGEPAISHPCSAFYIGREGWLRIPFFWWTGDTDMAATMSHEFGHYAFAFTDMYGENSNFECRVVSPAGQDPDNANGWYDISIMHNSIGYAAGRWTATEIDRPTTNANANCPRGAANEDVSWVMFNKHYPEVPLLGRNGDDLPVHSDSDAALPRGNDNGGALNVFIMDHAVGASSMQQTVRNDPIPPGTPEITITQPTDGASVGGGLLEVTGNVNRAGTGGNAAPLATITADVTSGTPPLDVTFSPGGSDSDGTIASWTLNYGDGTLADGGSGGPPTSIAHTYTADGDFSATLTLTDDQGAIGEARVDITVGVAPGAVRIGTDAPGDVQTGTCAPTPGVCERSWVAPATDGFDLRSAYVMDTGDNLRFIWQVTDISKFLDADPCCGNPAGAPNHVNGYHLRTDFRTTPATAYALSVERNTDTDVVSAVLSKRFGHPAVGSFSSGAALPGDPVFDLATNTVRFDVAKSSFPEFAAVSEITEMTVTSFFRQVGAGSSLLQTMDVLDNLENTEFQLSAKVDLLGLGRHMVSSPKAAPTAPPADPQITDGTGDVFQVAAGAPGAPIDSLDIESAWFENDADYMYVGLKVKDIPADPLATMQQAYFVEFMPAHTNFGQPTITTARVEAVLSAAATDFTVLPPGVTPTDLMHHFSLQVVYQGTTGGTFDILADLPLSSVDADSDILWFVIPTSAIENPAPGTRFSALGATTGVAVEGGGTLSGFDVATSASSYFWTQSSLPLAAEAGGVYTGGAGQPIAIVGTGSGGLEPYTCAWTSDDTSAVFADAGDCTTTVTFPSPGPRILDLTVTDANTDTATDQAGIEVSAPTGERVEIVIDGTTTLGSVGVSTSASAPLADFLSTVSLAGYSGAHTLTTRWIDADETPLASDSVNIVISGGGSAFVTIDNPLGDAEVMGTITINGRAGHASSQGMGADAAFGPDGTFTAASSVERSGTIERFCPACQPDGPVGATYGSSVTWGFADVDGPLAGHDGRYLDLIGLAGTSYSLSAEFDSPMDIVFYNDPADTAFITRDTGGSMPKTGVVPAGANWAFVYMRRPTQDNAAGLAGCCDTALLTLTPPLSAPRSLEGSVTLGTASLAWQEPQYDGGSPVTDYNVYRDGVLVGSSGGALDFDDGGLSPSTSYAYRVAAVNAGGEGPLSGAVTLSTATDFTAPGTVTSLVADPDTHSVQLSWAAAVDAESGISHYNVYRDGVVVAPNVAGTSHLVDGLSPDTTYDLAVSAVNGVGMEGATTTISATTDSAAGETVTVSVDGNVIATIPVAAGTGEASWSAPPFDTTTLTDGIHAISAAYDDGAGGADTQTINVDVRNVLLVPTVTITSPLAGDVVDELPLNMGGTYSTTGDPPQGTALTASEAMAPWTLERATDAALDAIREHSVYQTLLAEVQDLPGFLTMFPASANTVTIAFQGAVPASVPDSVPTGWTLHYVGNVPVEQSIRPLDADIPRRVYTLDDVRAGNLNHDTTFLPTGQTGIGPGTALVQWFGASGFICTLSFLTQDPNTGTYYATTAGHCVLASGISERGPGNDQGKADRVEFCIDLCLWNAVGLGVYVQVTPSDLGHHMIPWARQAGVGDDFGVIEIPEELEQYIRPWMPSFGGPMGEERGEGGHPVSHFGHGYRTGIGPVFQGRMGIVETASYSGGFTADGYITGGDSGSALGTASFGVPGIVHGDAAMGTLTHSSYIPPLDPDLATVPFMHGTDWQRGLDDVLTNTGIDLALVQEDGTLFGAELAIGPTADFGWSADDLTVTFTDASVAGDETITGWSWDFGGLGTSTHPNPTFTFPGAGTYTVTLTVTDAATRTDDASDSISVLAPPPYAVQVRLDGPGGAGFGWTTVATAEQGETGLWSHSFAPPGLPDGAYTLVARLLRDGAEVSSQSVAFTVDLEEVVVNQPPTWQNIRDHAPLVNTQSMAYIDARDADGDPVSVSVVSGLPPYVTFQDLGHGRGRFAFDPPAAVTGTSFPVTVRATAASVSTDATFLVHFIGFARASITPLASIVDVTPQTPNDLQVRIKNTGTVPGTFQFTASLDEASWTGGVPAPVTLAPGASVVLPFPVTPGPTGSAARATFGVQEPSFASSASAQVQLRVPVFVTVAMTATTAFSDVQGLVTLRYVDGSPAAGVSVHVVDEHDADLSGSATNEAFGTSEADGTFVFAWDTFSGGPLLVGGHTVTVEATREGRTDTGTTAYTLGP